MQLPVKLYRKNMAVGTIRHSPDYELRREQLDELVLSCRYDIRQAGIEIPYCGNPSLHYPFRVSRRANYMSSTYH